MCQHFLHHLFGETCVAVCFYSQCHFIVGVNLRFLETEFEKQLETE